VQKQQFMLRIQSDACDATANRQIGEWMEPCTRIHFHTVEAAEFSVKGLHHLPEYPPSEFDEALREFALGIRG
jgi:hypothetical protein